jgi:nitrite reductase/ring-hydroxylating ferredoxin subunit
MMGHRFPFPCLPTGWYAIALSQELKPGQILSRRYFERDLIAYRLESGEVRVADAFCPHMGANLGRVGCVEGDRVRCRFHGFVYGPDGQCVETPYGGPPPRGARLGGWPVEEKSGLVLVWYDAAGRAPFWDVPALELEGWTNLRFRRFTIPTHPQETTENSVDFGHFTQIHGFTDGQITEAVKVEGELLTTSYRAMRGIPTPNHSWMQLPVDYDVIVRGLGYSQVNVRIDPLRIRFRTFVLPIPIDDENLDLTLAVASPFDLGPHARLISRIMVGIIGREIEQDLDVWTYKTYLHAPKLAKGDGPVGDYRRYVKQFYPLDADGNEVSDPQSPVPIRKQASLA